MTAAIFAGTHHLPLMAVVDLTSPCVSDALELAMTSDCGTVLRPVTCCYDMLLWWLF